MRISLGSTQSGPMKKPAPTPAPLSEAGAPAAAEPDPAIQALQTAQHQAMLAAMAQAEEAVAQTDQAVAQAVKNIRNPAGD
jgi:hypothetical protein